MPHENQDNADHFSMFTASVIEDVLLAFVSNEKVKLADGKERTGLFYYLRALQSETGAERKDVIATVFKGVTNRMINGYLLRDIINKIDEILVVAHFPLKLLWLDSKIDRVLVDTFLIQAKCDRYKSGRLHDAFASRLDPFLKILTNFCLNDGIV